MDLPIGKVAILLGAGLSMLSLFFSDSPFFFLNSKSHSGVNAEIMIFGLEKKNEEGSGEWVLFLGFSKQELKFHVDFKSISTLQTHGT